MSTVAEPITRLDVTNTGTSTTAGINLNWTPGQETGPTDFIVKIEREDSIDSGTYTEVDSTTLTGKFILFGTIAKNECCIYVQMGLGDQSRVGL